MYPEVIMPIIYGTGPFVCALIVYKILKKERDAAPAEKEAE